MSLAKHASWLLLLSACTVGDTAPIVVDDGASTPHGIYVVTPKGAAMSSTEGAWLAAPTHRVLFLNRNGGTYTPGDDDSSNNVSSIPQTTATIPPYEGSDADWAQLVACMKDQYARFDIDVTDVDPGATQHIEAVFGGTPQDVGEPAGVGGVSPMYGDCSVVERANVFVFTQVLGTPQEACEVAAQESGHALGMDHEYLCKDPMTYLSGCGAKTFQDVDAQCGEYGPRACMCGGNTQNSVQHLLSVLGPSGSTPPPPPPNGGDTTPPTVAITAPDDGATLPANDTITVSATASDDVGVVSEQLLWTMPSGTVTIDCETPPQGVDCTFSGGVATWSFAVGSGARSFAVRASDAAGNVTTTLSRSLTLGDASQPPPPTSAAPTVSLDSPTDGTTVSPGDTIQVRATADDDQGVVQVLLDWQSPTAETYYWLSPMDGATWGVDLQLSPNAVSGSRTLVVTATDADGNATSTAPVTLSVP